MTTNNSIQTAMANIDQQRDDLKVIREPPRPEPIQLHKQTPMKTLAAFFLGQISVAPFFLVNFAAATLINGYVLHLLWLWFMVPIAHLSALTIGQAIAIYTIVKFVTYQYEPSPKETKENEGVPLLAILCFHPLSVLFIAQLVRNFI